MQPLCRQSRLSRCQGESGHKKNHLAILPKLRPAGEHCLATSQGDGGTCSSLKPLPSLKKEGSLPHRIGRSRCQIEQDLPCSRGISACRQGLGRLPLALRCKGWIGFGCGDPKLGT
jgi:hypothetical protein